MCVLVCFRVKVYAYENVCAHVYMCMAHIRVGVCMCLCLKVHACENVGLCAHMDMCVCVSTCTYACAFVHVCETVCVRACVFVGVHACMCLYTSLPMPLGFRAERGQLSRTSLVAHVYAGSRFLGSS